MSERIDEIKKEVLGRYIRKAKRDMWSSADNYKKHYKRSKGIDRAVDRLTREDTIKEEDKQQIDEISKKKLGQYIYSSAVDMATRSRDNERENAGKDIYRPDSKINNRESGIAKAVKKIIKVKEDEQLDELSNAKLKAYQDKAEAQVGRTHPLHYISKDKLRKSTNRAFGAIKAGEKMKEDGSDLLSAAYEARPIDFNANFNDKILDRIGELVNAKRIEMGKQYLKNESPLRMNHAYQDA